MDIIYLLSKIAEMLFKQINAFFHLKEWGNRFMPVYNHWDKKIYICKDKRWVKMLMDKALNEWETWKGRYEWRGVSILLTFTFPTIHESFSCTRRNWSASNCRQCNVHVTSFSFFRVYIFMRNNILRYQERRKRWR